MNRERWLVISLVAFVLLLAATIYLEIQNRNLTSARSADDSINLAGANTQPISFLPYAGDQYNACSANVGTPQPLSAAAAPVPTPTASPSPPVPRTMIVGDVMQVTIIFGCTFNDPSAVAKMRDSSVQFKPEVSALDFDVDAVMADELDGRNFYCVQNPADQVCKNGSTTPIQDLKWTWFLRPRSAGHHLLRFDIYQRKLVGKGQYVEIAPRWVKQYTVDVRQAFVDQLAPWVPFATAIAGLFPVITFLQKAYAGIQARLAPQKQQPPPYS